MTTRLVRQGRMSGFLQTGKSKITRYVQQRDNKSDCEQLNFSMRGNVATWLKRRGKMKSETETETGYDLAFTWRSGWHLRRSNSTGRLALLDDNEPQWTPQTAGILQWTHRNRLAKWQLIWINLNRRPRKVIQIRSDFMSVSWMSINLPESSWKL